MENNSLYWVFCLALLFVVALNLVILLVFRRKSESMEKALRRLSINVRNPWEAEDSALSELSERIADLKSRDDADQDAEK